MNIQTEYQLRQAVWEVTYLCNMRCKHCGSSCGIPLEDELTTEEALKLCDELGRLKPELITLSGGEPFLRKDWQMLAKRLTDNGISVNCISNGWYINGKLINMAKESGIVNIGVSVDGLKETHDFIRMNGSFERSLAALALMKNNDMPTVVCTTVNKRNIKELPVLKKLLIERRVERWQFQIGRPMGNLLHYPELVLCAEDIEGLVNFCHDAMKEGVITIDLADCIGYYSLKDVELRKQSHRDSDGVWRGCAAGKEVLGIRANGDISGCLSIRDDNYIEGNVREVSLIDLWTRQGAFAWNRELTKDKLTNFCVRCQYGSICLGACSGTKITMHNCITYNDHCLFKVTVDRVTDDADKINDVGELITISRKFISSKDHQFADVFLRRALEIQPSNMEVIGLLGFVNYFMKNYDVSLQFNKIALDVNPEDLYALEGYGLCLEKLGRLDEAVKLAVVLDCHGRADEAEELYNQIKSRWEEVR